MYQTAGHALYRKVPTLPKTVRYPSGLILAVFLQSLVQKRLYRGTYNLILAVNAANPAARTTYSFLKLRDYSFNMILPGVRFLNGSDPANPLVARERSQVLPKSRRSLVRCKCLTQA